ncbi:MAG TPA: Neelaredoxin [Spirochaetia bacterium]|nr:Neelaredoxin [Spirochaetia bacterium]
MASYSSLFQTSDWKTEKHVPVIECADTAKKGELFSVTVSIGKEVAHPNTAAHHIGWVSLAFQPDNEKYPIEIGRADFSAHGASAQGPDTSTVYTHHSATFTLKSEKPGTLFAASYCNIHGLWQNEKKIAVA